MKKTVKILGLLAAAFVMVLGFVGCGDASIDDGIDIVDVNDGTSGKDDGSGDAGGIDTIGDSWGALFTNKDHSPFDMQIWDQNKNLTAEIDGDFSEGMKINAKEDWVGVLMVQNKSDDGAKADSVHYDMSKVVKMTFEVKGTKPVTASCVYTGEKFNDDTDKPKNVNVTTNWQTVTVERAGSAKAFAPFTFVAEKTSGASFTIKNITYYDAAGNSVALKYVEEQ